MHTHMHGTHSFRVKSTHSHFFRIEIEKRGLMTKNDKRTRKHRHTHPSTQRTSEKLTQNL